MDLNTLLIKAEHDGISIDYFPFSKAISMSFPCDMIAVSSQVTLTQAEELTILAHEVGHCKTGSFYNINNRLDVRAKRERRADRWAIEYLIPIKKLKAAMRAGYTEYWDLAEFFNVTEPFIHKAVDYYKSCGILMISIRYNKK